MTDPAPRLQTIINAVIQREGGYVDNPHDPGGATNFGITKAMARANGYTGDMRDFPRSLAVSIYQRRYITAPHFDQVAAIDLDVAAELIDAGVNCGQARAAEWLQTALNAFNKRATIYANVTVDGVIGDATLAALRAYKARRWAMGTVVLVAALTAQRGCHYLALSHDDSKFEDFTFGWFARIAKAA